MIKKTYFSVGAVREISLEGIYLGKIQSEHTRHVWPWFCVSEHKTPPHYEEYSCHVVEPGISW